MTPPLTVQQTAEALGVSISTVYGLCQRRELAHSRPGGGRGSVRISRAALAAYAARVSIPVASPVILPPLPPRRGKQPLATREPLAKGLPPPEEWGRGV